jgi:epoxide hydrolase-like predicted phosphatase
MTIKAVIWDVGGVLVRTEDYTSRQELASSLGISRLELEDLVFGLDSGRRAQLGEISHEEHWENLRLELGLASDEVPAFKESFWGGDYLDVDLVDYIRSLRGQYTTGLLSNAFSDLRYMATQVWKFADAFDQMIISAEVGLMKPDERIYQLAVDRLDVAPFEAVFIDDFLHNVEGARSAGLKAVHFQKPAQAKDELAGILNAGVG